MGKDLRERFSGAIEALTRRNVSSQGAAHGDRSTRYRSSDVKKDKVGFYFYLSWKLRPYLFIKSNEVGLLKNVRKFDWFVGFTCSKSLLIDIVLHLEMEVEVWCQAADLSRQLSRVRTAQADYFQVQVSGFNRALNPSHHRQQLDMRMP